MAKILIIDDDEAIRRTLRRVLERRGHEVIEAENGKDGLSRFASEPADLVVTDIFMPERDGIEIVMAFRRRWPATKVIVISGLNICKETDFLGIARKLGATMAVRKPFDVHAFAKDIETTLASE